jgi:putative GTP pyrophosphokinase
MSKRHRAGVVLPDREILKGHYESLKPLFELRLQEIYLELRQLLEERGYAPTIKYRVKGFDNYFNKLVKLSRQEVKPEAPLSDLLGLRVICPFLEDLDLVEEVIIDNFDILELEHKAERHSFREFGYDSVHLLIRLTDFDYGGLPQAGPVCEVQLRTILQDAWAEVEHELVYKSDLGFPNDSIKRKLASLNASLTLSDLIFQEIRDYQKELRQRGLKRRKSIEELLQLGPAGEIAALGGIEYAEKEDFSSEDELKDSSRSLEKLMFRALEAHSNKNFSLAIAIYGQILRMKLEPQIRSLVYNHRGMALFALAEYQKAIEDFSKAQSYNEENARAWCNRGLVYRVLGRYDQSLKDFDQAIQINTAPFESFWGRAQTCYEMQLYSRALRDCDKVLSLQCDFSPAQELQKTIQRQMF